MSLPYVDGVEHSTLSGWLNALLVNNARAVKRVERAVRKEQLDPIGVPAHRTRCLQLVEELTGAPAAALERRGKKRTRSDELEELAVLAKLLKAYDPDRDAAMRIKIQNLTLPIIERLNPEDADARLTVGQRIAKSDLPWLASGGRPAQIGKVALRYYVERYHCDPPQRVVELKGGKNVLAHTYTPAECTHTVDRAIEEYEEGDDEEEEEEEQEYEDSFVVYTDESDAL